MTGEPLVSVVIPVYNRAYCITDAIESVLGQTHRRLECLVIDDGSTDDTVAVIEAAFAEEPRVQLLAGEHRGVSVARNIGLAHASGEYVTFLDSDDLMVDVKIEHQLAYVDEHDVAGAVCHQYCELVGEASVPEVYAHRPEWWGGPYHMSLLVETAEARAAGGFDEGVEIGEDIAFFARLVGSGARVGTVDEVLVRRRFFGDNASYRIDSEFGSLMEAIRGHRARSERGGERLGF